jgi:hypothetical protein
MISRPGDPEEPPERTAAFMKLEVSTAFWSKLRRVASTRMPYHVAFERALELAIADYEAKHGALVPAAPAALPEHTHLVVSHLDFSVYFYGRLAIGVDERCRLRAVGVTRVDDD